MKKIIPSTYVLGKEDLERLGLKGKIKFAQATYDSDVERASFNSGGRPRISFDAILIQIDEEKEV